MAKEKKVKAPKKEKVPKKERGAKKEKEQKEQKEETLLQKLMRQAKIKGDEQEEQAQEPAAAEGEPQEEQEEKPGGGKRKLLLIAAIVLVLIAVAVVVVFVILPKFSGDKDPEETPPEPSHEPVLYDLPASYQVGEETVKAVDPVDRDGVQAVAAVRVQYTYTGLSDVGAEVSAYVSSLREQKFSVVDSEFVRTDAPDYTVPEGTVLLAKNMEKKAAPAEDSKGGEPSASPTDGKEGEPTPSPADGTEGEPTPSPAEGKEGEPTPSPAEGKEGEPTPSPTDSPDGEPSAPAEGEKDMVLTVELVWSEGEGTMVVTCDQAEGKVTSPPPSERPVTPGASMTMQEAVSFLKDLEPSVLGLEGESMEDYHVYAMDGAVLVNGQPCMRLNVFSREETDQSNDLAGIYLMSRDGAHLYLLDEAARSVKEIKLP